MKHNDFEDFEDDFNVDVVSRWPPCCVASCAKAAGSASSGITHTALMPPVGDA